MSKVQASSLIEVARALDGDKEARFNVIADAIRSAYLLAFVHGNKTQLIEALNSTGKKVFERATRGAVKAVGVPSIHRNKTEATDMAEVMAQQVIDLVASVAFKEKAASNTPTRIPVSEQLKTALAEKAALERKLALATAQRSVAEAKLPTDMVSIRAYAESLPDSELAALTDALLALVEQRTHAAPVLKAA